MTGPTKKAAPAKKAESKSSEAYVVVGALIQAKVGEQLLQYSAGDVLPDGLDQDSLDHLLDNGLIQKGEVVAQPEAHASDDE